MEHLTRILFIADGMADDALEALAGKTPLQTAPQDALAVLAGQSGVPMVDTSPAGFSPGTETAIPLILGYDNSVLTGRGPVEAAGMGIPLTTDQFAMRVNLLLLDESGCVMEACPPLTDEEGLSLADLLLADEAFTLLLSGQDWTLHRQPGFRQLMTGAKNNLPPAMTPPHNVVGETMDKHLPDHPMAELMRRARVVFRNAAPDGDPILGRALSKANAIWPWGAGVVPDYQTFSEKFGARGIAITAVPVVRGMAALCGLAAPVIPGATGLLNTDWNAKIDAALQAYRDGFDFICIHLEAPDDCGHAMDLNGKLASIAMVDNMCNRLLAEFPRPFRLLLLPDHVTSTQTGKHGGAPVPWCLFDTRMPEGPSARFEENAELPVSADTPILRLFQD